MTCAAGTCDQRNYTPVICLNQASHATDVTLATYLLQFPYSGGSGRAEIAALVALMAPITAVAISRPSGLPSCKRLRDYAQRAYPARTRADVADP
jgi:hypothetical protein